MKKKILVLYQTKEEKDALEESLEEVVMMGVEIFFCDREESALTLIEKEKPSLVFSTQKKEGMTHLKKPFQKEELVATCKARLDLAHFEISEELPM